MGWRAAFGCKRGAIEFRLPDVYRGAGKGERLRYDNLEEELETQCDFLIS
jgi:hypothetical protein